MVNRINDGSPASPLRLVLYLGLAVASLTGTLAGPAYAENEGAEQPNQDQNQGSHQNDRGNERHQRPRHRDSPPQDQYNNNYRQSEVSYSKP